ncbi:MAG TPA: alternative ribosome rescue aminoacyl-tRNA hydrolase ArfB [Gemmatimonadales bacterium]|nr:alternative ribosome rescue aminoacyl-tRNA hydrolase ArfB [Gemmatimonadales bacterium]
MSSDGPIYINERLSIPRSELEFKATRSGGPGGQHVNTSSTRIELVWNVTGSPSLWEDERIRLLEKLAHRLDSEGSIRVVAQGERSQLQNREAAVERLAQMVARALVVPKKRKATRPSKASKEKRLEQKRRRGAVKRERRRRDDE